MLSAAGEVGVRGQSMAQGTGLDGQGAREKGPAPAQAGIRGQVSRAWVLLCACIAGEVRWPVHTVWLPCPRLGPATFVPTAGTKEPTSCPRRQYVSVELRAQCL